MTPEAGNVLGGTMLSQREVSEGISVGAQGDRGQASQELSSLVELFSPGMLARMPLIPVSGVTGGS